MQEISLKLWLHKENLLEINDFEAYLYTTTRNLCFDYLKKLAHEQAMKQEWRRSTVTSKENTEAVVIYNSYERPLQQAVEQLPPAAKKHLYP